MKPRHFVSSYLSKSKNLLETLDEKTAMAEAVGGDFNAVGELEFCLLKQEGLQPGQSVIDVGCGSGRLAVKLRNYMTGEFVGIDVVPDLFRYAEKLCARPDWRFYEAPGTNIPEPDSSADFVTFFSVFTHLLHEETYRYLEDSFRVLKPGGKVVFSFLEFRISNHWRVFEASVKDASENKVINQFVDRDMIIGFCRRIGFLVASIHDGNRPHIDIDAPVRWDDGREMTGQGNLGQSVCVLIKPSPTAEL